MNAEGNSEGRTYRITPIQEPERSSSFRGNYLSRIPLNPTLIIQLDCWDSEMNVEIPYDDLPYLVCHLTLLTPNDEDATMVIAPEPPDMGQQVSMLYGTLVANPTEMRDQTGATGIYFCFPDVSVRYDGRFKLHATLLRMTGGHALCTAQTEVFEVVPNPQYIAPSITNLTQHFHDQGIIDFGLPKDEW